MTNRIDCNLSEQDAEASYSSSSSSQKLPLPQRLPNECLYMVVSHLHDNLTALHSLLLVNKFFFHAALPYIMDNPFTTWGMDHSNAGGEKFFALMIASFLEARLLEQEVSLSSDQLAEQAVDDILKPFGIALVKPFVKPGPRLLRSFLKRIELNRERIKSEYESCEEEAEVKLGICDGDDDSDDNDDDEMTIQKMTTDYSKYFTVLSELDWHSVQFHPMIRLRKLPKTIREAHTLADEDGDSTTSWETDTQSNSDDDGYDDNVELPMENEPTTATEYDGGNGEPDGEDGEGGEAEINGNGGMDEAEDSDEEHTLEQQSDDDYIWKIRQAFSDLWIHFNYDCLTEFSFDISEAHRLLPFSMKMAKLQTLQIHRDIMADSYLENTILFIKQNQSSYPRKPSLDIALEGNWYYNDDDFDDLDTNDSITVHNAKVKRRRERIYSYMKPAAAIYKAVGRPRSITVTNFPRFYEDARELKLDRLRELCDEDIDRIDQEEGPDMEAFLRRCANLRKLSLSVGNPDLLTWAAAEALSSGGLSLDAITRPESSAGLHFATNPSYWSISQQPQQQEDLPPQLSSNLLRHLENLDLWTERPYRFAISALNDAMVAFSSSLQTVTVGGYNNYDYEYPEVPAAAEIAQIEKSYELQSISWANQIGNWPVFLPRLLSLEVNFSQVAYIQIGSFSQCPRLRELSIHFGDVRSTECRPSGDMPSPLYGSREYMDPRWQQTTMDRSLFPVWNLGKLVRLGLHDLAAWKFDFASLANMQSLEYLYVSIQNDLPALQNVKEYKNIQFEGWDQRTSAELEYGHGTYGSNRSGQWALPELKILELEGPPATMFSLDWLLVCPKLETVKLENSKQPQNIYHKILFASSSDQQEVPENSSNCDEIGPYLESQLTSIELIGPWLMTEKDTTRLLTVYAPFLEELRIERLHVHVKQGGLLFLNAVKEADDINEAYIAGMKDETRGCQLQASTNLETAIGQSRLPGRRLKLITARYTIGKRQRSQLGLNVVQPEEERLFADQNIRLYGMANQILVRLADNDRIKKGEQDSR
ncbi:hypothetical protein BGX27_006944 [Mortierella sp. AM989]|nr:hypothetical protein BGX27_006944 [Mortierella sp. AM989]